jgi:hypothetical protein
MMLCTPSCYLVSFVVMGYGSITPLSASFLLQPVLLAVAA